MQIPSSVIALAAGQHLPGEGTDTSAVGRAIWESTASATAPGTQTGTGAARAPAEPGRAQLIQLSMLRSITSALKRR